MCLRFIEFIVFKNRGPLKRLLTENKKVFVRQEINKFLRYLQPLYWIISIYYLIVLVSAMKKARSGPLSFLHCNLDGDKNNIQVGITGLAVL
jgi:hypothetical protein